MTGKELDYIQQAIISHKLSGNGKFTTLCHEQLKKTFQCQKALLTGSCTTALEMAAILIDIQPGDEIIMPSFTFVSTANAFVLRGAVPVFVDIRADTLNLDESKITAAITDRTKAIVAVHYAGVGCDMESIMQIAQQYNLYVIEDAAQAIMANYKDKPLGSFGHLAAVSFHDTKNIISGEGGALLINAPEFVERAEIIWEKGTNRSRFLRGQVDKYTWVDVGSSYLPSEITAAFLAAQLEHAMEITRYRKAIWENYYNELAIFSKTVNIQLPTIPDDCNHNAHLFYLKLANSEARNYFIELMKKKNIQCVFHYVPLHSSEAGLRYGKTVGSLPHTNTTAETLVRLPLWIGIEEQQARIIETVKASLELTATHEELM